MSINQLMGDDIFIQSTKGELVGPVKASVQGNKVYISDESLVIEEGGKILRPLPNGKSETHTILEVNFRKDPFGGELSHYEIKTRKDSSLVTTPGNTTINITNSQGIQIGNQNVQSIVGAIEMLTKALNSANASPEAKVDAKARLKAFLSHPVTVSILGAAAGKLLEML
jgi:predicted ATP-grasp superfamily ATP-dependent carboligase